MKSLDEGEWAIVDKKHEALELRLAVCTGIFAFGKKFMKKNPYLVIHTPPLQKTGVSGDIAMKLIMSEPYFNSYEGEKASIHDLLIQYQKTYFPDSEIGVYLASGLRADDTDLLIARFISSNQRYELMGAELNQMCRTVVLPKQGKVELLDIRDKSYICDFKFGSNYNMDLRL